MAKAHKKPVVMPPLEIKGVVGEPVLCVKVPYESEGEAYGSVAPERASMLRAYLCPHCQVWHLTSRKTWK